MSIVTRLRYSDLETRERREGTEARALEHPTTGIQKRLKGAAVTEKDGGACRWSQKPNDKGFQRGMGTSVKCYLMIELDKDWEQTIKFNKMEAFGSFETK